jgi:putative methionine-R-sulfoxide reductase with GAF domain
MNCLRGRNEAKKSLGRIVSDAVASLGSIVVDIDDSSHFGSWLACENASRQDPVIPLFYAWNMVVERLGKV